MNVWSLINLFWFICIRITEIIIICRINFFVFIHLDKIHTCIDKAIILAKYTKHALEKALNYFIIFMYRNTKDYIQNFLSISDNVQQRRFYKSVTIFQHQYLTAKALMGQVDRHLQKTIGKVKDWQRLTPCRLYLARTSMILL